MARKVNYLDLIPAVSQNWSEEAGVVTVHVAYRGVWDRIAQALCATPPVSHIQLDEYGSFLWERMDGTQTVGQLAAALESRFGSQVAPLYDRLVRYLEQLRRSRLIRLRQQR